MPLLSPQTVLVNDGDIKLYKRARSSVWQATFNIDGRWVRITTKRKDLDQAKADAGKKTYLDYIIVIERYLIPFFGKMLVTNIDYDKLKEFDRWRIEKMGRDPKASTLRLLRDEARSPR